MLYMTYGNTGGNPVSLTMAQADQRLRGDADGETMAALVHARGAKPTFLKSSDASRIPMGTRTATTTGVWRWQDYSDPRPRFATRDGWYASHVAREEVLAPLEAAIRWVSTQPELQ